MEHTLKRQQYATSKKLSRTAQYLCSAHDSAVPTRAPVHSSTAEVTRAPGSANTHQRQAFLGLHQSGIVTPRPAAGMIVAFDVLASDREDLERLLRTLDERIRFLMQGGPVPEAVGSAGRERTLGQRWVARRVRHRTV